MTRLSQALADLERRSFVLAVLVSGARSFDRDHCFHLAAGIAYYAIFSLFPLLLGLIALATLLLQSAEAQDAIINAASQLLPGSTDLMRQNIQQVLRARGTIGAIATVTLLWSAKAIFGAITTSVNLAWNVPETRPFWKLTAMELALVFGAGGFFILSFAITSIVAIVSTVPIPVIGPELARTPFWTVIAGILSLSLNTFAYLMLYRFLPATDLRFRDVWPGAVVAGILFEIAKIGYVFYTAQFANYQLVYGSLGAVIALLFWAWLSSAILLFGAEISAQYGRLKRR